LSQLFLNSHSPVVLKALLDKDGVASKNDAVFLADSASIVDPVQNEVRRHTRLRSIVGPFQAELETEPDHVPQQVTRLEVERILNTAQVEG
jgi:hypothetical protein